MINYPNKKVNKNFTGTQQNKTNNANKGMALEEMIEISNNYYKARDIAYINKRPVPVKILKTENNYHIVDAFFSESSTLDYVGIFKGKYIDFDAKESINKNGLQVRNISEKQIEALRYIKKHGGIAFLIIFMKAYNEIYLLEATHVLDSYDNKETTIKYEKIKELGHLIKEGYLVPVDYLKIIEEHYL